MGPPLRSYLPPPCGPTAIFTTTASFTTTATPADTTTNPTDVVYNFLTRHIGRTCRFTISVAHVQLTINSACSAPAA